MGCMGVTRSRLPCWGSVTRRRAPRIPAHSQLLSGAPGLLHSSPRRPTPPLSCALCSSPPPGTSAPSQPPANPSSMVATALPPQMTSVSGRGLGLALGAKPVAGGLVRAPRLHAATSQRCARRISCQAARDNTRTRCGGLWEAGRERQHSGRRPATARRVAPASFSPAAAPASPGTRRPLPNPCGHPGPVLCGPAPAPRAAARCRRLQRRRRGGHPDHGS